MDIETALPSDWEVWHTEQSRIVLVYRPDVFDSDSFPAPCLPTIYLTKGQRGRRPGRHQPSPDDPWYVTLSLEPDVSGEQQSHDSQESALEGAVDLATAFAAGEFDYRALYQVPRDSYLEKLDALTGREA